MVEVGSKVIAAGIFGEVLQLLSSPGVATAGIHRGGGPAPATGRLAAATTLHPRPVCEAASAVSRQAGPQKVTDWLHCRLPDRGIGKLPSAGD